MHENAKRMLKKITASSSGVGLADLAKLFQAEARKLLAAKGSQHSAEGVAAQASSLARNHLRTLVSQGYVKRVGRGEYVATAKTSNTPEAPARKAPARKAPARKAPARKAPARKAPARQGAAGLRAELTKIKQQLRQLTARVKKLGSSL